MCHLSGRLSVSWPIMVDTQLWRHKTPLGAESNYHLVANLFSNEPSNNWLADFDAACLFSVSENRKKKQEAGWQETSGSLCSRIARKEENNKPKDDRQRQPSSKICIQTRLFEKLWWIVLQLCLMLIGTFLHEYCLVVVVVVVILNQKTVPSLRCLILVSCKSASYGFWSVFCSAGTCKQQNRLLLNCFDRCMRHLHTKLNYC